MPNMTMNDKRISVAEAVDNALKTDIVKMGTVVVNPRLHEPVLGLEEATLYWNTLGFTLCVFEDGSAIAVHEVIFKKFLNEIDGKKMRDEIYAYAYCS